MIDMATLAPRRMCAGDGDVAGSPECASPVITVFLMQWNDYLPDVDRDRLLRPLIPHVVGTRTTGADESTRSLMALDWLVRTHLVAWLRLSPSLVVHAEAVAALPAITTTQRAKEARAVIAMAGAAARLATRDAAWWAATRLATRAATWAAVEAAAAEVATGAATWAAVEAAAVEAAAAESATRDATRDATRAATRAATWAAVEAAAAEAATGAALTPTVLALQASAQQLVRDMCAVGRVA